ncbi:PAS domain S-box protein [Polaromonas sp.]|uniref:PAS domain S-box protein n=1 Tax=Polaromonas sp. TaxID=1869339 RepID=UPI001797455D|nr:PAS domain S-box protein [Polaromonas sp.]NMM08006.1 PAS domain S-box protein [Polaromonas sp.]
MLSLGGLRSRLVLLVLIALLPVFGLFAYSAAKDQQDDVALAQGALQSTALLAAAHQQRLVDRVAQLLGNIASAPSVKDTSTQRCVQYLEDLQSQAPGYSNLGIAGLDGKVTCNARNSGTDVYAGDRPFFKQVLAGQKFAGGQYGTGRSSGWPGIGFGVPVHGSDGVLNGVAFAAVDITAVAGALAEVQLMDGAQLRVTDSRGTILAAHPADAGLPGSQEQDAVMLDAARSGRAGVREGVDVLGVERVYGYAPVGGAAGDALFVAISVPRDIITAGPREHLRSSIAALLGMAVFGVCCAWWIGARLIVRPARAILKEASEVIEGNLAARIASEFTSHGELGQIALSFNRMAGSLQLRREERDAALQHADKERALRELIFNSMSEGVVATDTAGRLLLLNRAARALHPAREDVASLEDWSRDHDLLQLDGKTSYPPSERPVARALGEAVIDNWDLVMRRPGTEDRVLRVSTRPLREADQMVGGVVVFSDITALKAAENLASAQEQVLALIAGGAPLRQSLEAIVRLMEKNAPGTVSSILLLDGQRLRHAVAPSLPESYRQALESQQIKDGTGPCGTAAFRKEAVVVEDVAHDPITQAFRQQLLALGLRACWSLPVVASDDEVLATLATYRQTPGKPQAKDLDLSATAARLARLALERARADAALVGSEARFRELAENLEDVFYNVDPHTGQLLYVSPGYEKIWGRSCESLYDNPKSYADAVRPEDKQLLTLARQRIRAGEMSDTQYRIVTPEGKMRWIRDHAYPVFNAAGALERVVGTARDITASKLADLALASTNRALQMLSRFSMAINQINDEASMLAEVCRVAVEVGSYRMAWVGYAQHDALLPIAPMAHAGDERGYLAEISRSSRDDHATDLGLAGQAIRVGLPQQSGDISQANNQFYGREAALERGYRSAIFLPLRDGQRSFGVLGLYAGQVQHFASEEIKLLQELADNLAFGIGSLRARLARHRSEEAARQAAAQLREQASLLDRAQDAIMVRNLDLTLRFWNQGAQRLYGWSADEVLGKTMAEHMYRDPQVLDTAMQQTLARGGDWSGELEQRARDGSIVYVEARWTVVRDEHGQVNGVLGINTDIRERKRAREEILQLNASLEERVQQRTAQLEYANKELEAFSYSVSHDLRSPLSAIDGFSDLLERALAKTPEDSLSKSSRHYLGRLREGVSQMGELIDALLTLAQVARSRLRWEPVNLSELAEALLHDCQEREPGRATQLQVEPGLQAHGDARLLKQVLDNLLGNAWKFSAGQARSEISFGQQRGSKGETVYVVRDNGAGFDMRYAEKLFGPFQRLHGVSEFSGTGIGLATVQRIVVRHGGTIWGESAVGRGATFYFTLGASAPED